MVKVIKFSAAIPSVYPIQKLMLMLQSIIISLVSERGRKKGKTEPSNVRILVDMYVNEHSSLHSRYFEKAYL